MRNTTSLTSFNEKSACSAFTKVSGPRGTRRPWFCLAAPELYLQNSGPRSLFSLHVSSNSNRRKTSSFSAFLYFSKCPWLNWSKPFLFPLQKKTLWLMASIRSAILQPSSKLILFSFIVFWSVNVTSFPSTLNLSISGRFCFKKAQDCHPSIGKLQI